MIEEVSVLKNVLFKYYVLGGILKRGTYAEIFIKRNPSQDFLFGKAHMLFHNSLDFESLGIVPVRGWQIMQDDLRRIKEEITADGEWFLVVLIPDRTQVYADMFHDLQKTLSLRSRMVAEFCQREHILCADMTAPLIHNRGRHIYWVHDGHLSQEGHRVVAEAVKDFLIANGLTAGSAK